MPVFRDEILSCPRCTSGLDPEGGRLACGSCRGVLVPERELLDQISTEQVQALLRPRGLSWSSPETQPFAEFVHEWPPPIEAGESPISCPSCAVTMTKHSLFTVIVDRCPAHGVWLDGDHELRTILATATHGL